jgi:hypothetical protein
MRVEVEIDHPHLQVAVNSNGNKPRDSAHREGEKQTQQRHQGYTTKLAIAQGTAHRNTIGNQGRPI